jgi:hypothetical protein
VYNIKHGRSGPTSLFILLGQSSISVASLTMLRAEVL